MRIAKEEVFWPVVNLTDYDNIEEAISVANDTEYALSAVISGGHAEAAKVALAHSGHGHNQLLLVVINNPATDAKVAFLV